MQLFDFEGIKGRLQSSSYTPTEEQAEYSILIKDLEEIFNKFQIDGVVQFLYDCEMYFAQLNK